MVTLAGVRCEFDELYADSWVAALLDEDPGAALLSLLDEDVQEDLLDATLEGRLNVDQLGEAFLNVVTTASGRPWWFTMRLLHAAQGGWDVLGGYLALHGVRAQHMTLQAYMDALLATVMRHTEPKNQNALLTKLKMPPAGIAAPAIDEAREEDVFRAYMRTGQ